MRVTTKIDFWADTLVKASVDELEALHHSLSHSNRSSNLVLMVQAEIERRNRRATRLSSAAEP